MSKPTIAPPLTLTIEQVTDLFWAELSACDAEPVGASRRVIEDCKLLIGAVSNDTARILHPGPHPIVPALEIMAATLRLASKVQASKAQADAADTAEPESAPYSAPGAYADQCARHANGGAGPCNWCER